MMKKMFLLTAAFVLCMSTFTQAQEVAKGKAEPYKFTDIKINPTSSVKDQSQSGTCWSFSGVGLIENELLKNGKGEADLSEMWIVRNAYFDRAVRYARMHGKASISGGGSTGDVFTIIKKYGAIPEESYRGLNYGKEAHQHAELDQVIESYMNGVIKSKTLTTAWQAGLNGILDAYFGAAPEKFTYKGKEYTPMSYAKELGLDMDDYVIVTSFTHHPFYSRFVMEVPDNWNADLVYNVTIDDLSRIVDYALDKGYSINWSSDVSEPGFQYNKGFAIMPATTIEDMSNTEKSKWTTLTPEELKAMKMKFDGPMPEINVTQELRQAAFDNYQTTDDHGMVIVGTAKDQMGNMFYKVKNSWNTTNTYAGYFYASKPFILYKSTGIALNKKALPKDIAKKLGL